MSKRFAFLMALVICIAAIVGATVTAPLPAPENPAVWRTQHVRASAQRSDYWMAFVALEGRDDNQRRDTLARAEIVCLTDSGARILVGVIPEKPFSDTVGGQASYFTTVRARVVSKRPFRRMGGAVARLEGDWPYRRLSNGGGYVVIRTGAPVRRLASGMSDDRLLQVQFADGRIFEFPLHGADTATASVLSRCVDL